MSYAAILVHVQTDDVGRARLRTAVALAQTFDAALIGLGVEMVPPLSFDNGYVAVDAEWYVALSKSIEDGLTAARTLFEAETAGLAKGGVWLSGMDYPGPALVRTSRGADLIVANAASRGQPSAYRDAPAGDLAITAGRPVLVAPPGAAPLKAERVILAWKDSREARRAMADALPFLKGAKAALVLEVCAPDEVEDAKARVADVAELLRRHGVAAEVRVSDRHATHTEAILAEARAFRADLIAAGAYGHSRFGEWVFGGVTRDLIAQHEVHVLLSH